MLTTNLMNFNSIGWKNNQNHLDQNPLLICPDWFKGGSKGIQTENLSNNKHAL